jgi:hypothetical protein
MSASTNTVAMMAPQNRCPVGNSASAAAETPTVPMTVISFGVSGVRARA